MKINTLILAVCLFTLSGCGLIGKNRVTNEQINADLNGKTVKFNGGKDEWFFSDKEEKCFLVNDKESKITDSNADVSLTVSSWRQSDLTKVFFTVYGKMLMRYKTDGGKWVLESIEPRDATQESFSSPAEFKIFLDVHTPVCKGFRHTNY